MPLLRLIHLLVALALLAGCAIPTAMERRYGIPGIAGEIGADGLAEELVAYGIDSEGAWVFSRDTTEGPEPVAMHILDGPPRDPEDFFHRIAERAALPGETTLALHAYRIRPGAPPNPVRLDCELVNEVAHTGSRRRSVFAVATYPVWGLPRDLLDAPWTAVRRHRWFRRPSRISSPNPPTAMFMGVSAVAIATGTAVFAFTAVSPVALAIPVALAGVPAGLLGGYGAGVAAEIAVVATTRYVEVPLLRSGISSEHYFPNWKFIAHAPVLEPTGLRRWLVTGADERLLEQLRWAP